MRFSDRRVSRRRFLATAGAAIAAGVAAPAWLRLSSAADPARGPATMRWPAEWEPHARTLMSMPFSAWIYFRPKRLHACQREWAAVARAIARFEPVTMVIPPGRRGEMRELLGKKVTLLELPYNDGWLRDNGPIFLSDGASRTGLDWGFNGWGGAFGQPFALDDALPGPLCQRFGIPRQEFPIVMEGGSLQCDGQGTIITTEECLLNPNRNPSMTKAEIEAALLANFNAQKVIWLPYGLLGDLTSGHVDGVCQFIGSARVIAQVDPNDAQENARLQDNLDVLEASTDALGRPLEVVRFPFLPRARFAGGPRVSHCYINFYPTNNQGLIVPTAGLEAKDRAALRRLRQIFPGREVVGVPTPNMTWAGGGVHCVSQQLPKAS